MNFRHGDVLIIGKEEAIKLGLINKFDFDKKSLKKKKDFILAEGEVTGHFHRLDVKNDDNFDLLEIGDDLFLDVKDGFVPLVHEEHKTIEIPKGEYFITIQREYDPEKDKRVID